MNELYELEQQLLELRSKKNELVKVRTLLESPIFKQVIHEDLCNKESMWLISRLVNAPAAERTNIINALDGISVIIAYLDKRLYECNAIDSNIETVEQEINDYIDTHRSAI